MPFNFLQIIEILGTASFAISGTSQAIEKRLDIFGVIIIAFVTSIGGGTLRDVLIGNLPVGWLKDATTIGVILAATIVTLLFRKQVLQFSKTLFIFDSLGLGLFTIIGIQKGMALDFSPGICIALGTMSACFGGVIRDVLLNNVPLIFRKEIYASACIAGGILYFGLYYLRVEDYMSQIICIITIFLIRIVVVRYKLSLPGITYHK